VTSVAAITRRVPEGLWDPTKIPGIQDSLSVGGFLFSVGGVALSQIDTHIGPTRSVRQIQLDGTKRSADSRGPRNFSVSKSGSH